MAAPQNEVDLKRDATAKDELPTSRFAVRDLLNEASLALTTRPARTALTALGTIIGVAALIATLGLANTAGNQIVSRFDELEATRIEIRADESPLATNDLVIGSIPWDSSERLMRLNGVVAAGTKSVLPAVGSDVRSVPFIDPLGRTTFHIPVVAVTPGFFDAARTSLAIGRLFDYGHDSRGDNVAVLGPRAADALNINRLDSMPAITIDGRTVIVIGVLSDTAREPDILNAVLIPNGYARDEYGLAGPHEVLVDVEVGAAELIGEQAAIALSPNDPDRLEVSVPRSPDQVRGAVEGDVNALFLLLGGVSLLVGAIGIANVTLVSVLERRSEIGLRRALGATREQVARQFIFESATLGAIAGVVGASLGVIAVVWISIARDWTPVLDIRLPLLAPAFGATIGLVAGIYPAWKAGTIEPITALRSS